MRSFEGGVQVGQQTFQPRHTLSSKMVRAARNAACFCTHKTAFI